MLTEQYKYFGTFTLAAISVTLLPSLLTYGRLVKEAGICHILL